MPRYLDTRGKPSLSVAVCDRCKLKYALSDLKADRNAPGMLVCDECNDVLDPYRLPARQTERVDSPNARPDEPIEVPE